MQTRFFVVFFALLFSLTSSAWAGERGYFGFGLKIDGEGAFWNPTLKSVKIGNVSLKSPAFMAGMVEGDEVVEVEGKLVAGAKGKDLQGHIQKDIGQSVRMKVKRASGEVTEVTLVAAAKTW